MDENISKLNQIFGAFKIKAKCINYNSYRHFFYYDAVLEPGYKISKLNSFSNELSLALKAPIPIIKAIPSLGVVRFHFTCRDAETLHFEKLYASSQKPENFFIPFLLGESELGEPLWIDMSKNPHLLIGGSSGSGKSVFLHILIANALKLDDIDLYLIDPKKVEFNRYSLGSCVRSIDVNLESANQTLDKLISIMETRFEILNQLRKSNIEDVPHLFRKIVVIIDEFSELSLNEKGDFEFKLIKLAAKCRAAGIYLTLATQRPSVDVVTGLIKANFPARVACKTASQTESKIILDSSGAEHLGGRGDCLIRTSTLDNIRFQAAYVGEK